VSEGSANLHAVVFCCRDLDLEPVTLKLDHDSDILQMYLLTENEVPRSRRCNGLSASEVTTLRRYTNLFIIIIIIIILSWKSTKIAPIDVKGQGQMSPTSNHF